MFDYNDYLEAKTVQEAVNYLAENSNARVIAGGTDVLIKLRDREDKFVGKDLVGITRIPELKNILMLDDGSIVIGATASFTEIEHNEIVKTNLKSLAKAAGSVGGPQVRNMGTIGGNISNGATSADTAATLFAFNAMLLIQNKKGIKETPISEFYVGPGKVALEQGDLLVGIKITKENYENLKGDYIKFAVRNAMDIANLGCSVLIHTENNKIKDLRIAFGVAGPTPLRATVAEEYAIGKEVNEQTLYEIGEKCLENTKARDSWRASKRFREQLIKVLPKKAIEHALGGVAHA